VQRTDKTKDAEKKKLKTGYIQVEILKTSVLINQQSTGIFARIVDFPYFPIYKTHFPEPLEIFYPITTVN